MPLTSLHPPFRADQASACECLGPEAPLARVLARVTAAIDQLATAMVVICVAAVWLAVGGFNGMVSLPEGAARHLYFEDDGVTLSTYPVLCP